MGHRSGGRCELAACTSRQIVLVSGRVSVMSQSLSEHWIARWLFCPWSKLSKKTCKLLIWNTTQSQCLFFFTVLNKKSEISTSVQHRVVTLVHCKIIAMAAETCLESLCRQWRRILVPADCSAVECDHCRSQRPTRDLRCLLTLDEALSRQCMKTTLDHQRPLHSPTHTVTDNTHTYHNNRDYTKTAHRQNGPDQNGPKNFNA